MDDHCSYSNGRCSPTPIDLSPTADSLGYGIAYGRLGPDNIYDLDTFQFDVKKGATYRVSLEGGSELIDLNWGRIIFFHVDDFPCHSHESIL